MGGARRAECSRATYTYFNTPLKMFIYRGSGSEAEHRYYVCGDAVGFFNYYYYFH